MSVTVYSPHRCGQVTSVGVTIAVCQRPLGQHVQLRLLVLRRRKCHVRVARLVHQLHLANFDVAARRGSHCRVYVGAVGALVRQRDTKSDDLLLTASKLLWLKYEEKGK